MGVKKQKTKNLFLGTAESKSTSKLVMLRKGEGQRIVKLRGFSKCESAITLHSRSGQNASTKNAACYMRCSDTLNQTVLFREIKLRKHLNRERETNIGILTYMCVDVSSTRIYCSFIFLTKTIVLPVVFNGCETWSLTLSKEHRLKVFENRMLRKIFGPKRDEMIGGWRKLHNKELHNLYYSPNMIRISKSRRMR
jgi:hypothetical protein